MSLKDIIQFILGFIFKKDELDFSSQKFNPVKFVLLVALCLSIAVNVTLIKTIDKVRIKAEILCPSILTSDSKSKNKK